MIDHSSHTLICILIMNSAQHPRPLEFTPDQLQQLHGMFTLQIYQAFRDPSPWAKEDPWYRSHVPLVVGSKYGQNELMDPSDPSIADEWNRRVLWDGIRYVSGAVTADGL